MRSRRLCGHLREDLFRHRTVAHIPAVRFAGHHLSHGHVVSDAQRGSGAAGRTARVRLLFGRGLFPGQSVYGERVAHVGQQPAGYAEFGRMRHWKLPGASDALGQAARGYDADDDCAGAVVRVHDDWGVRVLGGDGVVPVGRAGVLFGARADVVPVGLGAIVGGAGKKKGWR